jgi:ABC-2 type transport system permease protein
MNAFISHFSFEFRTGIRNRTLLFMTYLFPLAVYLFLGVLMTAVYPAFKETMIPAMVIFAILASLLLSLPDPLINARRAGIFRSYWINGVPASSILTIPLLSAFFHLVVIGIIITISASLLFQAPLPINWLSYILIFIVTIFACGGLGLLIGVVSSSSQMTVLLGQLIFLPSMLIGGLMMPASILPPVLAKFSLLLPTSHAMNAFRGLAYNLQTPFNSLWSVLILFAGGLLAIGLALYLFTWDNPDSRQKKKLPLGLLAILPYVLGVIFLS